MYLLVDSVISLILFSTNKKKFDTWSSYKQHALSYLEFKWWIVVYFSANSHLFLYNQNAYIAEY